MCQLCDDLFSDATKTLDELLQARRARDDAVTVAQNGMRTATTLLHAVDSEEHRTNRDVQHLCLALGVAVERLAALEQSGIPT
jgi:hypothetical protein